MKLYEIFINGRFVDAIEARSRRAAVRLAEAHFGAKVTAKVRKDG